MLNYLTPEEAAQILKVEVAGVISLVNDGKLRVIRIGGAIRIPESELERLYLTSPAVASSAADVADKSDVAFVDGTRWCLTRQGVRFRVAGCIASGAAIWPGKMRYSIKFPKEFMDALLSHFRGDVAVGGKFDDPGRGSIGEFIQSQLGIKMNPRSLARGAPHRRRIRRILAPRIYQDPAEGIDVGAKRGFERQLPSSVFAPRPES